MERGVRAKEASRRGGEEGERRGGEGRIGWSPARLFGKTARSVN